MIRSNVAIEEDSPIPAKRSHLQRSIELSEPEDRKANAVVPDAVFSRLSVTDLKNVRLVCKAWKEAASDWLAKVTVVTSKKDHDKPKRGGRRGIPIHPLSDTSYPLFEMIAHHTIKIRHLEIDAYDWDWTTNFNAFNEALFGNPITAALETLRISGFNWRYVDRQLLPYYIPNFLKELKSLTLLWPVSNSKPYDELFSEEPSPNMKLEKIVVDIFGAGDWRPSWKFPKRCPHLKCFKLLGREVPTNPDSWRRLYQQVPTGNFTKCLEDAWPYLEDKRIEKIGLKFSPTEKIEPIAAFMRNIAAKGTLLDVSYEMTANCERQRGIQVPKYFPVPCRTAKFVLDQRVDLRQSVVRPSGRINIYADLEPLERAYMNVQRLDIRLVNYGSESVPDQEKLSVLFDGNAATLRLDNNSSTFNLGSSDRLLSNRLLNVNYVCCPWQVRGDDGTMHTRLLEMMVPEKSLFFLPGINALEREQATRSLGEQPIKGSTITDASVIHQHAVCVSRSFRTQDLYCGSGQTYVFASVEHANFIQMRDKNQDNVEMMDISAWKLPKACLAMVRTITTKADPVSSINEAHN